MLTFERDGSLTFRVYLPHARSVELVADFTGWTEEALELQHEPGPRSCGEGGAEARECGWWSLNLRVPDGDHAFSYLVDGQWWLPDYAAHGVKRNEFGNWTSVLFVPPAPRMLERLERRRVFGRAERREVGDVVGGRVEQRVA